MEQFTIHITVGARSKATFQLTYEEVLKRRLMQYDIIIKVRPKQLVHHFEVFCKSPGRTPLSLSPTSTPTVASSNGSALSLSQGPKIQGFRHAHPSVSISRLTMMIQALLRAGWILHMEGRSTGLLAEIWC